MQTWSIIIGLIGALGIGSLITSIIERILNHRLQKKKFQFENLYIKRAKVVDQIYKKLDKTQRIFLSLTSPFQAAGEPSQEEKAKKAAKSANDFLDYFNQNRLYLEEEVGKILDNINNELKNVWIEFNYAKQKPDFKKWSVSWEKVKDDVPQAMKKIRERFREIIGLESKDQTCKFFVRIIKRVVIKNKIMKS